MLLCSLFSVAGAEELASDIVADAEIYEVDPETLLPPVTPSPYMITGFQGYTGIAKVSNTQFRFEFGPTGDMWQPAGTSTQNLGRKIAKGKSYMILLCEQSGQPYTNSTFSFGFPQNEAYDNIRSGPYWSCSLANLQSSGFLTGQLSVTFFVSQEPWNPTGGFTSRYELFYPENLAIDVEYKNSLDETRYSHNRTVVPASSDGLFNVSLKFEPDSYLGEAYFQPTTPLKTSSSTFTGSSYYLYMMFRTTIEDSATGSVWPDGSGDGDSAQEDTQQQVLQQEQQQTGLLEGIASWLLDFFDSLKTAISSLFVPSQDDLLAIKQNYDTLLSERLGFVYQFSSMAVSSTQEFINCFSTLDTQAPRSLVLPEFPLVMGGEEYIVWEEQDVISSLADNTILHKLRPYVGTAVAIVCTLAFADMAYSACIAFLSGKSWHDFVTRKGDEE